MSKYSIVLQFCALLFIVFIIVLFIKYIRSLMKVHRIKDYTLTFDNDNDVTSFTLFINRMSSFLKHIPFLKRFGNKFNRFIFNDSRFNEGMDYVSLKIVLMLLFGFLYLFITMLYKDDFSIIAFITTLILGFIIPSFYCFYIEKKNYKKLNDNILTAIIIISNSYSSGRSTQQAINDVVSRSDGLIKYEFTKISNDIKIGITYHDAFLRAYKRTGIYTFLRISRLLALSSKSDASILSSFKLIEQELNEENNLYEEVKVLKDINKISNVIFSILPLVFLVSVILLNKNYINMLSKGYGFAIILIIAILYILYLFILSRIVGGNYKDEKYRLYK